MVGDAALVVIRRLVVAHHVGGAVYLVFNELVAGEEVDVVPVFRVAAPHEFAGADDHVLEAAGFAVFLGHRVPLRVFGNPAEGGGKGAGVVVDALGGNALLLLAGDARELGQPGRHPHRRVDMAHELVAPVEVARLPQQGGGEARGEVERDFVLGDDIAVGEGLQHHAVADELLAAPGVAREVEAAVKKIDVVGELVVGLGLVVVARPEGADLALDDERPHPAHQSGGALLGLLVVRVVADKAVEGGKDVAHFVERAVHRVRPGILVVVAQPVRTPVGEEELAEGGQHFGGMAILDAKDLHAGVEALVPGGDEFGVIDAAVGGLCRLLVGENEPIGKVAFRLVGHLGEVVEGAPRAGLEVEVLVFHGCRLVVSLSVTWGGRPPAGERAFGAVGLAGKAEVVMDLDEALLEQAAAFV